MSEENTISNISLNGETYTINDSSKATIESVEELTSITTTNNDLLTTANSKLDQLLQRINAEDLDTSDATATSNDILSGFTAYVNRS